MTALVPHRRGTRVLLVCSSGGHLAQLYALKPWWSQTERMWVTFDTADATSLLSDENVTFGHHPTTRNIPNLMRNWRMSRRILRKFQPDVVVSSGAGIAVPYFWGARRLGIRTAYVEVIDRITTPTLTGRMCYPVADSFFVQLPEQLEAYPEAEVIGSVM